MWCHGLPQCHTANTSWRQRKSQTLVPAVELAKAGVIHEDEHQSNWLLFIYFTFFKHDMVLSASSFPPPFSFLSLKHCHTTLQTQTLCHTMLQLCRTVKKSLQPVQPELATASCWSWCWGSAEQCQPRLQSHGTVFLEAAQLWEGKVHTVAPALTASASSLCASAKRSWSSGSRQLLPA